MSFRILSIRRQPSPQLLQLLRNNVIGTPGRGMLYQHLEVHDKIDKIQEPYFVVLERNGQLAGTCCFCGRETKMGDNFLRGFYVRYFSFSNIFRRSSVASAGVNKSGRLKAEVEDLLQGTGLNVAPDDPFYHYAYVDPRNERSAVLCEAFGFEKVREYTTVVFSRLMPSTRREVSLTTPERARELLSHAYANHSMHTFENLMNRPYYHVEENGIVVAGVQVNPDRWKILSMPGAAGNLMLNLFSKTPFLNRLLNRNFRFLTVESIFCLPGHEKALEELLETLLHRYRVYSAIAVVDTQSPELRALQALRLGLVNALSAPVTGHVIVRFRNMTEEMKHQFRTLPAFISGIDVT